MFAWTLSTAYACIHCLRGFCGCHVDSTRYIALTCFRLPGSYLATLRRGMTIAMLADGKQPAHVEVQVAEMWVALAYAVWRHQVLHVCWRLMCWESSAKLFIAVAPCAVAGGCVP